MQKLKTDVVVMGTGGAGLAAAVSAAEGGARVIVFEKNRFTGGISQLGMGIFAVESRLQHLKNVPFTRDDAFKLAMEHTHWRADARLVRAFIDKTASTIEWLENMGVEFELLDVLTFPGCVNQTGHIVKTPAGRRGGITATMIKIMREKAKEKAVEIRLSTPVKKILKEGEQISGVIAEEKSGETIQVAAKAVIIASGGYAHNKEMLKKYGGFELGRDFFMMHTIPLTGEGIQMAWELGAVPDGMCPMLAGVGVGSRQEFKGRRFIGIGGTHSAIAMAAGQPYLWINQHGERFTDEGQGNGPCSANAVARQKNHCSYTIFDEDTKKHVEEEGTERLGYMDVPTIPKRVDLDADIKKALDEGFEDVFVANSLAELANKIGVNPDALQKTADEYNKFCEKGHDDLFAKNPKYLRPVKKPKLYAFKRFPGGYGAVGGIKINERAEVLNKEDEVIPGLYAAGDCADGIHTYDFSLGYILWGSNLGFAINSGRIAGENALKCIGK
jgi:fumarate reductase flavoprotein subunit